MSKELDAMDKFSSGLGMLIRGALEDGLSRAEVVAGLSAANVSILREHEDDRLEAEIVAMNERIDDLAERAGYA